jgi:hypothetical protein
LITALVVKRVHRAKVSGSRGRGRPKLRWMDDVKAAVENTQLASL